MTTRADLATGTPTQHARVVRKETLISVSISTVLTVLITWRLFGGMRSIPLWGVEGGVIGLLPGTFLFTLVVTTALTLVTRRRVRTGMVRGLARLDIPVPARLLPQHLVPRALTLAALATATLVPTSFGVLSLVAPPMWSFPAILFLNVAYFVVLAMIVTPLAVWRAFADGQ